MLCRPSKAVFTFAQCISAPSLGFRPSLPVKRTPKVSRFFQRSSTPADSLLFQARNSHENDSAEHYAAQRDVQIVATSTLRHPDLHLYIGSFPYSITTLFDLAQETSWQLYRSQTKPHSNMLGGARDGKLLV